MTRCPCNGSATGSKPSHCGNESKSGGVCSPCWYDNGCQMGQFCRSEGIYSDLVKTREYWLSITKTRTQKWAKQVETLRDFAAAQQYSRNKGKLPGDAITAPEGITEPKSQAPAPKGGAKQVNILQDQNMPMGKEAFITSGIPRQSQTDYAGCNPPTCTTASSNASFSQQNVAYTPRQSWYQNSVSNLPYGSITHTPGQYPPYDGQNSSVSNLQYYSMSPTPGQYPTLYGGDNLVPQSSVNQAWSQYPLYSEQNDPAPVAQYGGSGTQTSQQPLHYDPQYYGQQRPLPPQSNFGQESSYKTDPSTSQLQNQNHIGNGGDQTYSELHHNPSYGYREQHLQSRQPSSSEYAQINYQETQTDQGTMLIQQPSTSSRHSKSGHRYDPYNSRQSRGSNKSSSRPHSKR